MGVYSINLVCLSGPDTMPRDGGPELNTMLSLLSKNSV